MWNSSPTSSLSFSFFSYSGPSHQSFIRVSNHFHHHAKQNKYASKPATTCTTTFSLIGFRLTISTISSTLSYEIVDDFDPYLGYFYVSLFSDLENTEIPSPASWIFRSSDESHLCQGSSDNSFLCQACLLMRASCVKGLLMRASCVKDESVLRQG